MQAVREGAANMTYELGRRGVPWPRRRLRKEEVVKLEDVDAWQMEAK